MSSSDSVVIVGAGHAGGTAAVLLRQFGFAGAITLIGDEPLAPYQRPPLSKTWLKEAVLAESLLLRPLDFYTQHAIGLRLGVRVDALERAAKTVRLRNGERIAYDRLILATGRRARRLNVPGADLEGVLELRTVADGDRLKAILGLPGRRLVVIGGGYIGLEAAAAARSLGAAVTVIEKEPRVLARVACERLSHFFHDTHRAHGVVFKLGIGVDSISGRDGHASGVQLSDGRRVEADAVLVGVGGVANDELARAAGLDCANGIRVDLWARTSDSAIHAIGDCSYRPLPHYHRDGVLESVQNAIEQARQAASDIAGRPVPLPEVPWFWSDQYDLKLQIAGLAHDVAQVVVRGEPRTVEGRARFAVFHLSANRCVQAVEAINAVTEFMTGRQLISSRKPVDVARLADPAQAMKDVAA
jgi:3-phenylpropionate/trans-cinnamate dioxygenase ferredoxin reductase component